MTSYPIDLDIPLPEPVETAERSDKLVAARIRATLPRLEVGDSFAVPKLSTAMRVNIHADARANGIKVRVSQVFQRVWRIK